MTKISYSNRGVTVLAKPGVKTEREIQIDADFAICTIPLGVLQKEDVEFNPPFSNEKMDAINHFRMGNYEKIYAQFPYNFWGDKEVLMSVSLDVPPSGSIMTWGLNLDIDKYFKGSHMLTFHSMGSVCRNMAKQGYTETREKVYTMMKNMFGEKATYPSQILVTNWTYDPYSYGSWSHMPYGFSKLKWALVRKNEKRLYFAGEHTSYNYGFVHSAYQTGLKVAEDIYNIIFDVHESPSSQRQFCPTNMY